MYTLVQLGGGDNPPTEFRLFRYGENETTKGVFIFDEQAAETVMASANAHKVDFMIDLEHLSLDSESSSFDPDARGWCRLEVRNGELWAVDVRWTPDGLQRLRERRQRYISPTFSTDDDGRVYEIFNIALTAVPATHGTPALVAASKKKEKGMNPKQYAKLLKLRRDGVSDDEILTSLAIDMKTLQSVAKAMGGDPNAPLGDLIGMVAAFAQELADMGKPKAEAAPEGPVEAMAEEVVEEEEPVAAKATADEIVKLRKELEAASKKDQDELTALRAEKVKRDAQEHRDAVARIVSLGGITPAMAWADDAATQPSAMMSKLSKDDLDGWAVRLGGAKPGSAPVAPSGSITTTSGPDISEYEAKRVTLRAKKYGVEPETAIARYRDEVKAAQLSSAQRNGKNINRFGRAIEAEHALAGVDGQITRQGFVTLGNPVKPIETYGSASQRAVEEFRTEYMVELAALPADWVGEFGDVLPGGSLKDTYPLDFSSVEFQERKAQNAAAETPQSAEISVSKREFRAAKMGDWDRIMRGDFAYLRSWQQGAAQMARGRAKLRASLVTTLLEANGAWAVSTEFPSGLDGENFFSASHLVNPFKGADTFSNYQGTAAPLNANNLTAEKANMLLVPFFDGLHFAEPATDVLVPTVLSEAARLLLTVQDIILDSTGKAGVRNEHYQSGFGYTAAPQLAGSGATANYYLMSRGIIGMGFVPWVVAEDGEEEVLEWNQDSEFYKNTGKIKIEMKTFTAAALLWPHGIRLVAGS